SSVPVTRRSLLPRLAVRPARVGPEPVSDPARPAGDITVGRMTDRPSPRAYGWGVATIHDSGEVLDTYYPAPSLEGLPAEPPAELAGGARADQLRQVRTEVVRTEIDLDAAPADAPDGYLRLHLLSHRLVRPWQVNLDGIFGVLANVVWT